MSDKINPEHYKRLPSEAIEIIESAIDNAPSAQDAYLHGQVLKYVLRCWHKNGIEDLKKAKWYLDRLIEHCDLRESLLDISKGLVKAWECENGKAKQVYPEPKWTPKVGDWVRIKKPSKTLASSIIWFEKLDRYDGRIIQVKQIEDYGIVHDDFGFLFDWLEPAEAPKQPQPPDGWRWLEADEKIRNGDKFLYDGKWQHYHLSVGEKVLNTKRFSIRRNRFEVGERVVAKDSNEIWEVDSIVNGVYQLRNGTVFFASFPEHLAPYIEEAP